MSPVLVDTPKFKWAIRIIAFICFGALIVMAFDVPKGLLWKYGFLVFISALFGFMMKVGSFDFIPSFQTLLTNGDVTELTHALHMIFWSTFFIMVTDSQAHKFSPLFKLSHDAKFSLSQAPIGVSLAIGSYLFGVGMELTGGCAAGTLVRMGKGVTKSWVAIWFIIIGSTLATLNPIYRWWRDLPKTSEPVDIGLYMIIWAALSFFISLVIWVLQRVQRRRERDGEYSFFLWDAQSLITIGVVDDPEVRIHRSKPFYKKEWWRFLTDIVLAICVGLFFICVGSPLGVMGVLPLIGSKHIELFTDKVKTWDYWVDNQKTWEAGILNHVLFYSDLYILVGALLASAIMGDFGKQQQNSVAEICKAMIGGLLMGFGAKMSGGCNIGSMLGGITSGSVHGWVWMACAALGSGTVTWTELIIGTKTAPSEYESLAN